ncbi:MAG: hypothetical protein JSW71_09510 [Gemmatimonadota bacterium]|nr:MAG: hypothetical protein JSW71_09510 [Gemmatimonadota bacterium]
MRHVERWMLTAALGVIVAGALACSDEADIGGPSSGEGPVTVSLTTPHASDGALLVAVTGPGPLEARPANSTYRVYWRLASAAEMRVLVLGNITEGPVFTVRVPDPRNAAAYSSTVLQVADRDNELRTSTEDYSLTVTSAAGN